MRLSLPLALCFMACFRISPLFSFTVCSASYLFHFNILLCFYLFFWFSYLSFAFALLSSFLVFFVFFVSLFLSFLAFSLVLRLYKAIATPTAAMTTTTPTDAMTSAITTQVCCFSLSLLDCVSESRSVPLLPPLFLSPSRHQ